MDEASQKQFFWQYAEKREDDFKKYFLVPIKIPKSKASKKDPTIKLTPDQLALLKLLNLV
jgi:hypothetical protein